jgi:hypothetical protein
MNTYRTRASERAGWLGLLRGPAVLLVCLAFGLAATGPVQGAPDDDPPAKQENVAKAKPGQEQNRFSDAEREALIKKIKQLAEQAQKEHAKQQPPAAAKPAKPETPTADTGGKTAGGVTVQRVTPRTKAGAAAQSGKGCAPGTKLDLTPPPPDQPQPELSLKEQKVVLASAWQGQQAKFEFELSNKGEGQLNVHLKGG